MSSDHMIILKHYTFPIILGAECKTKVTLDINTSPDQGKECIFPFEYRGNEYNSCTNDDSEVFWCATDVNERGHYVEGSSKWGECNDACRKHEGL